MAGREEILIEGYRPRDLPDCLGPELEAEVMNGRPMVARVGTAEILSSLSIRDTLFRADSRTLTVREVPERGFCHYRRDSLETEPSGVAG